MSVLDSGYPESQQGQTSGRVEFHVGDILKSALKAVAFLLLCTMLVVALSAISPIYGMFIDSRDTFHGMQGRGDEPVQVVAVGTSVTLRGFSPVRLYEQCGIASYNCATSGQPSAASYYALKEALRMWGG